MCSARCKKYGIQPMSPSVSEKVRSGNRNQKSAHNRSPSKKMDMTEESPMPTEAGASVDVEAALDEDPTCRQRTVAESEHAAKRGSQWPEWIDGIWSADGFSEKGTAWHPLAASRRTSSAALCTSNSGKMPQAMNRSG